ncbi:hypothetical protein J6590_018774 [Homalodisca vitripennis]|nr:hypothetical protein J6590_018774 [Homalodisca vitripennis]
MDEVKTILYKHNPPYQMTKLVSSWEKAVSCCIAKAGNDIKCERHCCRVKILIKISDRSSLVENAMLCQGGKILMERHCCGDDIYKSAVSDDRALRRDIVEIAAHEASLIFNEGNNAKSKVLDHLKIKPGKHFNSCMETFDVRRVRDANKRTMLASLEERRARRRLRIEKESQDKEKEGQETIA